MIAPTSFFTDYGCHMRILEEARVLQWLGHHVTIAIYTNGSPVPGSDIRSTLPVPWQRDYGAGSSRPKMADGECCPVSEESWLWHLRTVL
jgi:hypothetical protein